MRSHCGRTLGVVPLVRSPGKLPRAHRGSVSMIRLAAAALLVTVCLGSAGCADNLLKERPVSRTAQLSGARPTFSAVGSAKGESSVCGAYRRQLRLVQLTRLTQTGKA